MTASSTRATCPASGRIRSLSDSASPPPRRGAQIAALLSDDNRAILAWAETRAGVTRVYAELSAPDVRFGAPRLLERFADPGGMAPPVAPRASCAWPPRVGDARLDGRRIRALGRALPPPWTSTACARSTRSPTPGRNALLADLAPGPAGEASAVERTGRSASAASERATRRCMRLAAIDRLPGAHGLHGSRADHRRRARRARTAKPPSASTPTPTGRVAAWRTAGRRDRLLAALGRRRAEQSSAAEASEQLLPDQESVQRDDQPGQRERRQRWSGGG